MNSTRVTLCAAVLVLAGCSVFEGDKVEYKSAGKAPSLEVPPDLTQLMRETRYVVPGSTVSASSYQSGRVDQSAPVAARTLGDVSVERLGNQRWLVVKRPADQLLPLVRDFWQENGFLLAIDQPALGILETDWAENRAKLPQDFIRQTLGKVLDSLYSTGERDKFRTRLERNAAGDTEIYISHRGMIEVYGSSAKDQTVWQPRPADPELEAEFLRRLMVRLGVQQEQAKTLVASGPSQPVSRIVTSNNLPTLQINEGFDRAWRRVGLALDRGGFTVEDRDRAQGLYFVRYVAPNADKTKADPGFIGKLFSVFSSTPEDKPLKYRIAVRAGDAGSNVTVLNEAGAPDSSANAQRILQLIADDLK